VGQQASAPQGQPDAPPACSLSAEPASITAGDGVKVRIGANFSGTRQFDLQCGNITRSLLSENTLAMETDCVLGEPGFQKISLSSGGQECASAVVEVRGKAAGTCHIDSASVERDLSAYNYRWTVRFAGFSDGDVITWACDSTVGRKAIRDDPVWGMPLYESLSCDFPSAPKNGAIPVSIAGVQCGQVSTR